MGRPRRAATTGVEALVSPGLSVAEPEPEARTTKSDARSVGWSAIVSVTRSPVSAGTIAIAVVTRASPPAAAPLVTDDPDLFDRIGYGERRCRKCRSRPRAQKGRCRCTSQAENEIAHRCVLL